MYIGKEEIKRIREACILSKTEFAHAIGVSVAAVSKWEMGKGLPTPKSIRKIIAFCKENGIDIPD